MKTQTKLVILLITTLLVITSILGYRCYNISNQIDMLKLELGDYKYLTDSYNKKRNDLLIKNDSIQKVNDSLTSVIISKNKEKQIIKQRYETNRNIINSLDVDGQLEFFTRYIPKETINK